MSRIKQFFRDVLSPLYHLDEAVFTQYLNDSEVGYLNRLRRAERLHVVQVARKTAGNLPNDISEAERCAIIKAVLLHDVGKYHYAMGPFAKTAMVLFGKQLSRESDKRKQYSMVDVYRNHAQYSWELVKALESFPDHPYLYDLIRYHHEPERFLKKYGQREQAIFAIYKQADDES